MPETASASGARNLAARVLRDWRERVRRPEALLNDVFAESRLDARDRRLVMELVYGVIRNLTNLDFILSHFVKATKKGVSPGIRDILRLAAYQVIYLSRIPAHAAVNEAVKQAGEASGRGAAGFVNAVLRALIRDTDRVKYPDPKSEPAEYLSIKYSYPEWLAKRWLTRFGFDGAQALMEAGNRVPPLTLRANTLKTTRESLMELFRQKGVKCRPGEYAPDAVIVEDNLPVRELPGYREGLFAVQDEAAQLVPLLLGLNNADKILDACSAPGGKAAHMAALSSGRAEITAMDINLDKLRLVKENITRLGINSVRPVLGDAGAPLPVKGPFDVVLLDAPCSATGVIRRRPEIKHMRKEDDITRMADIQARILDNLAGYVRPGGIMVYSVCSTEPEEGELMVEGFLAGRRNFTLEGIKPLLPDSARGLAGDEGCLRTLPHLHGTDGFFAARMRRI